MLGIVGTGLIGASIGIRARENGTRVAGYDPSADALQAAVERGAIDLPLTRDGIYEQCESIVIAAPPEATCAELRRLSGISGGWRLLADVASVKRPVMKAADGVRAFVATHPLAGNEGSGASAATGDLFEGRTWAYVPSGDDGLDARARALIASLGAEPFAVDAGEHDRGVAVTSHLPQMVAWLLATRIRAGGPVYERLCGPAGREVLRLARSQPSLWREILAANADVVVPEARLLARELVAACGVDASNGP